MITLIIYLKNGDIITDKESSFENAGADFYNHYILDQDLEDQIVKVVIKE